MELIVLPAKLTWLLQPLDTHAFALLKRLLHSGLLDARAERQGLLDTDAWWRCMVHAVDSSLMHRDWWAVFKSNGLASEPLDLWPKLRELGLTATAVQPRAVDVADLVACLPERCDMTKVRVMWRYATRPRLPLVIALLPPPAAPALPPPALESQESSARVSQRRRRAPAGDPADRSPSPVARRLR